MRSGFTLLFLLAATIYTPGIQAQFINTFAGNGTQGYAGDGGDCRSAEFSNITGVAFDGAGNVYIADMGNNVVRKVNTSGTITTLAGSNTAGYSGDGGAATMAKLNGPYGVAVDGVGNVYISDNGNNVIRKVWANGKITTYAGKGAAGYSGDNGAASAAMMSSPQGIAVDGTGNLFIADAGNNAIRMISTSGKITTVAGMGSAGYTGDEGLANSATLNAPASVAVDPFGQIYIADFVNQVIRKVDTSGVIHTFAGSGVPGYYGNGGPATAARLLFPEGVSVFGFSDVYIADQGNNVIRHVDGSGNISNAAGNAGGGYTGDGGFAVGAELKSPKSVAADGVDRLYIADFGNDVVRRVSATVGVGAVSPVEVNGLSVFPNPSSGSFSVEAPAGANAGKMTVTDILGRVVAERIVEAANQPVKLQFSGIPAGSYIIKLDAGDNTAHTRVEVW